jgi:hypothetical protein
VSFFDGGTYTVTVGSDSFTDNYTASESEISIYSGDCGTYGTYEYSIHSKTLTMTKSSDNCSGRAHVIDGDWKKK